MFFLSAIFLNIENKYYVKTISGNNYIASVLSGHLKPYRDYKMTDRKIIQPVENVLI